MAASNAGMNEVPLPEYEVGQYFPVQPELDAESWQALKDEYGLIRAYFKTHADDYHQLQRSLNQARMGVTYDRYLERAVHYSGAATLVGLLLGLLTAYLLAQAGMLDGLRAPNAVPGGLAVMASGFKVAIAAGLITLISAATFGGGTWAYLYLAPGQKASTRRRSIDFTLPHAIVFMYAMSYGGMNFVEVISKLADSRDAYGAVAEEFDMVHRDVELFGNDLYTSLRNARNLTPSDNLEQFIDDMVSVLDSGGDITAFLEEQSARYLRRAQEEQEDFLETLSVMSEVFIVGFVAAPLFLIVILMIISVLGGQAIGQMAVLIYLGLPLGVAGFIVLLSTMSEPYKQPETHLAIDEDGDVEIDGSQLSDDPEYLAFAESHRWDGLRDYLDNPLGAVRATPVFTLVATVPAAMLYVAGVVLLGLVPTSTDALLADPITATTLLVVVPMLLVTVPLSVFHELKRGHDNEIVRRFPDTLNILSSANNMGIQLTEAFDIVARWSTGKFADELRTVRNDIRWNGDTRKALLRFANRLDVPPLSRTIKLIADGGSSSSDLSRLLSIAAEDTRNQYTISRDRKRAMTSYIAVVVIGFLVYLMVIALLNTSYLGPLSEISGTAATGSMTGLPGVTAIPIDTYRMLFFHSVLVQAIGCGLITGMLSDNDLLAGLKYAIAMVLVATLVFQFI
ncbi:flagellar protein FlaJ [Halogranum gelatinilyticum]|uniref:Flagellar protein FlaJ n=1 Tax=Halogranum gelatinilyticum TaxID=660521 RepID=A0A1G9PUS8_9EURY|nr:type II secretion system F family protein [Halogranum gelatinilyticum]SDM02413.1 flagellar protein FlaJ [Halogranum gelatinilyticum]